MCFLTFFQKRESSETISSKYSKSRTFDLVLFIISNMKRGCSNNDRNLLYFCIVVYPLLERRVAIF